MIKFFEKKEYKFVQKKYKYFMFASVIAELILLFFATHITTNYRYLVVYSMSCLGMVILFVRQTFKSNMLYAYKRDKLKFIKELLFLSFIGEYFPARFVFSHIYSYFSLVIGILLITLKIHRNFMNIVSVSNFTLLVIFIFNLLPFILFSIIEGVENKEQIK